MYLPCWSSFLQKVELHRKSNCQLDVRLRVTWIPLVRATCMMRGVDWPETKFSWSLGFLRIGNKESVQICMLKSRREELWVIILLRVVLLLRVILYFIFGYVGSQKVVNFRFGYVRSQKVVKNSRQKGFLWNEGRKFDWSWHEQCWSTKIKWYCVDKGTGQYIFWVIFLIL